MTTIDAASIESLRLFAVGQHLGAAPDMARKLGAFAHMCTAALQGEEWAVERLAGALHTLAGLIAPPAVITENTDADRMFVISSTDTTRPDGAIARSVVTP